MTKPQTNMVRLLGGVFVGLALYRFLTGEPWIVWLILGFLFGGFSLLGRKKEGSGPR
jgi:F0F1-type ATP synthase assembly protein I